MLPGRACPSQLCPNTAAYTWLKLISDNMKAQIYKLANKGLTTTQISVILRDSHIVAQVCFVTSNKILSMLNFKALAPDLPEDPYHLIKKAIAVSKHLERTRKNKDAKFFPILIKSCIYQTNPSSQLEI
ncbi:40S ribosomal protein S13-like [Phyllostomus discolor]|uniref:40S ribosomal protein S13-like n=1 Tax=Phyllostomus discolor TaxID=89673 RepID=A0A6J2M0F6_9CHIR|nr:40S ribosomal protein S13-like [Phyllostomus discolor]